MKIFICFFTLFSFELFANQTQYACSEWKLVLKEYVDEKNLSFDDYFTETKGVPFLGIEENNQFTLKDMLEVTTTLNYIGRYNDIIRFFSSYESKHDAHSIFMLKFDKKDNKIIYDRLEIQQVHYMPEYTYKSNCYLN